MNTVYPITLFIFNLKSYRPKLNSYLHYCGILLESLKIMLDECCINNPPTFKSKYSCSTSVISYVLLSKLNHNFIFRDISKVSKSMLKTKLYNSVLCPWLSLSTCTCKLYKVVLSINTLLQSRAPALHRRYFSTLLYPRNQFTLRSAQPAINLVYHHK